MPKLQFYDHGKQFSDHRALCEALVVAPITFIISFVASKPTDDCLETCNLPVSWSAFKALPAFRSGAVIVDYKRRSAMLHCRLYWASTRH